MVSMRLSVDTESRRGCDRVFVNVGTPARAWQTGPGVRDHYDVLQVADNADQEVIASAYRSLAGRYHPDVSNDSRAAARMKEIIDAYAILSNPAARAEYDRERALSQQTRSPTMPPYRRWDPGPWPRVARAAGATRALVLGLCSVLLCPILGPLAIYVGVMARRRIHASGGFLGGEASATAGIVLGFLGTVAVLLYVLYLVASAALSG